MLYRELAALRFSGNYIYNSVDTLWSFTGTTLSLREGVSALAVKSATFWGLADSPSFPTDAQTDGRHNLCAKLFMWVLGDPILDVVS